MNMILKEDCEALRRSLQDCLHHFEGRSFLITGAAGFLGHYLTFFLDYLNCHVLDQGVSALLLDSMISGAPLEVKSGDLLKFQKGDVSDIDLSGQSFDYVIHAAGIASPHFYSEFPIETLESATLGTRRMLDLCRDIGCKSMIFFSSSEVYGNPHEDEIPTRESYNGNVSMEGPRSCYDESKRMGETLCFLYARQFGLPVKIVRPFNVYGPGFRPQDGRVIPNFIERGLRGEALVVHCSGEFTRTFCYIADCMEAVFKILFSSHSGQAFNVGNPEPEITIQDLALRVNRQLPASPGIVNEQPQLDAYTRDNPLRRCPDISKLKDAVDFSPGVPLEEGIRRTIEWYREQYAPELREMAGRGV